MAYLAIAAGEVGYKGPAENVNKYWADLKPAFQGEPWCFCFVSWCLWKDGSLGAIGGAPMYYCPAGVAKAQAAGQWFSQPEVGALVFYTWGTGVAAHVEFVTGFTASTISTIGGNTTGDVVAAKTRARSEAMGYWHLNAVPGSGGGMNSGGEPLSNGPAYQDGVILPVPVSTLVGAPDGQADVRFSGQAGAVWVG